MTCETNVCGTGGWTGPVPGDPDNNITMSATTIFGGIRVSWSYPTTNPHAVAHTLLYRSNTANFADAVQQSVVSGSHYTDHLTPTVDTEYWYWIRMVSINGTINDVIGPVSAIAKVFSGSIYEYLTGVIDETILAQELKTKISGISLLNSDLYASIQARIAGDDALAALLADVEAGLLDAMTYINQEIINRTEGDNALVQITDTIAAANADNLALIIEERTVRVTETEALASDVQILYVTTNDNTAAIVNEQIARTDADSAMASSISTLAATVDDVNAAVQLEASVRADETSALAQQITTVEVSLNNDIATVEVGISAMLDTQNEHSMAIGAMYTAKVEVNGLIGGFGIYNNGDTVDAGFDVDRFWVGRTGPDKVKPFIIDSGIVYMDKARIRNADIDMLKIAGNSVVIGGYVEGGGNSASAGGGAVALCSYTIDLGDAGNSGLIVQGAVSVNSATNASAGFRITVGGATVGDQRASIQGGYAYLFPVTGFVDPGSSVVSVTLWAYAVSGSFSVESSAMSILGGKR